MSEQDEEARLELKEEVHPSVSSKSSSESAGDLNEQCSPINVESMASNFSNVGPNGFRRSTSTVLETKTPGQERIDGLIKTKAYQTFMFLVTLMFLVNLLVCTTLEDSYVQSLYQN